MFVPHKPGQTPEEMEPRLESHEIEVRLEVASNFGRNIHKGDPGEITAWVDSAPTNRDESLRQYVVGVHNNFLRERGGAVPGCSAPAAFEVEWRLRLQPHVRECLRDRTQRAGHLADPDPGDPDGRQHRPREGTGLDHQFLCHSNPRIEFLAGKQLPYIGIGMINHVLLLLLAVAVFGVPLKGSGWMLTVAPCSTSRPPPPLACSLPPLLPARWRRCSSRRSSPSCRPPSSRACSNRSPPSTARPRPGHDLAHQLLHARQRRHIHQGPGGRGPLDQHAGPGCLHSRPDRLERRGPAAQRPSHGPRRQHTLARSEGVAQPGERPRARRIHPVRVTLAIISQARGVKSEVNNASLAFIDEDQSQLSKELIAAFYPPRFQHPQIIAAGDATASMDRGRYMSSSPFRPGSSLTFVVAGPPRSRLM